MAETTRNYNALLALLADQITQDTEPVDIRDMLKSLTGCYCLLDNTGVDKNQTVVVAPTISELGSGGAGAQAVFGNGDVSPFAGVNTNSADLTGDAATGRITIGADTTVSGVYLIFWMLRMVPHQTHTFAATLPETVILSVRKNYVSVVSTGTDLGGADQNNLDDGPIHLPFATPITTTRTEYIGGVPRPFVAKDLMVMSASAVSGGTDRWENIQVTNLGPAGNGTDTLFASAKTTNGSSLTAGVARAFTFDTATPAKKIIAAGDILKVQIDEGGTPADLSMVAVRGYENRMTTMFGFTLASLVGGDYVSLGGYCNGTSATFTVKNGFMLAVRRR